MFSYKCFVLCCVFFFLCFVICCLSVFLFQCVSLIYVYVFYVCVLCLFHDSCSVVFHHCHGVCVYV